MNDETAEARKSAKVRRQLLPASSSATSRSTASGKDEAFRNLKKTLRDESRERIAIQPDAGSRTGRRNPRGGKLGAMDGHTALLSASDSSMLQLQGASPNLPDPP